ncbi:MAG: amidohydrolase, partial [Pirellulales bacterium]|nr:amidohydrolase [Pirellulales bacterium]
MNHSFDPELRELIDTFLSSWIQLRHHLHAHPQTAYRETDANRIIRAELERLDIPYAAGLAETGVVGWIMPDSTVAAARPAIGLRADIDALPVTESTGLEYASIHPGTMHACGHDGHTAILLGAAEVLVARKHQIPRPIKVIFQPAEEMGGGAARMIDDGALDDRTGGVRVGWMFGLHGWPRAKLGTLQTRSGLLFGSNDSIRIRITGRPAHAAAPHHSADPVLAAAHAITALQSIVSRNVDPVSAAVVSITTIHGGSAYNVIPGSVELTGTIRAHDQLVREWIQQRIHTIAIQTAAAFDCRTDVQIDTGYPATVNDPEFTGDVVRVARDVLGDSNVRIMEHPEMVAEDFAFYGQHVPSCFVLLGLCPEGDRDYPD